MLRKRQLCKIVILNFCAIAIIRIVMQFTLESTHLEGVIPKVWRNGLQTELLLHDELTQGNSSILDDNSISKAQMQLSSLVLKQNDTLDMNVVSKDDNNTDLIVDKTSKVRRLTDDRSIGSVQSLQTNSRHNASHGADPGDAGDGKPPTQCPLLAAPGHVDEDDRWRVVEDNSQYAYSAYYDNRTGSPRVIVLGVENLKRHKFKHVWCQLWYSQSVLITTQPDVKELAFDSSGREYNAIMTKCKLSAQYGFPVAVSLVLGEPCNKPSDILKIHYTTDKDDNRKATGSQHKYNFTVCMSSLNGNFSRVNQLLDTIESNRHFGAEHFVFYNHSYSSILQPYLDYYTSNGLVSMHAWDIPLVVDSPPKAPQIHYFGQAVAVNDCLYRHMYTSEYIVFTDLDELIVPHVNGTWQEVMSSSPSDTASWMFRNVFFFQDWESDNTTIKEAFDLGLNTLLKTRRELKTFMPRQRSKVIVKPESVSVMGCHVVTSYIQNAGGNYVVPEQHGLLHHYRVKFDDTETHSAVDRTMHKFGADIVNRVKYVHSKV